MDSDSKVNELPRVEPSTAGPPAEASPDLSRKALGKFELRKKLGAGGMGWVYLAYDTVNQRNVALKVLPRSKAANPLLVKRFKSEAEAAAQLNHPNIVRIYEAGEVEGYLYISLEYFKGTDVYQLVTRLKTLPVHRSIDMIRQVLRALDHAFEKAIVHRDIKPSNLLVSRDGTVKLTDMGLARSMDETADAGITRAGTTVGTVDYMAPEQARDSRAADVRSDLYSLACTWYHMLAGEPPFPGGTLTNKLFAHVGAPRPDPRLKNPAVPKEIVDIMHKMMARKPKDRYSTPIQVLDAMESLSTVDDSIDDEEVGEVTFASTLKESTNYETGADFPVVKTPTHVRLPVRPRYDRTPPVWSFVDVKFVIVAVVGIILFAGLYWYWISNASPSEPGGAQAIGTIEPGNPEKNQPQPAPVVPAPAGNAKNQTPAPADPAPGTENKTGSAAPPKGAGVAPPAQTAPSPANPNPVAPSPTIAAIPPWVDTIIPKLSGGANGQNSDLPVVIVGREDGSPGRFPDLASAFETIPSEGGFIQLVGAGPFALPPTELTHVSRIVLRGDSDKRSVVVLTGVRDFPGNACLTMWNGTLVLDRVDLVLCNDSFPADRRLVAIRMVDGNLAVRDSSCTLQGGRTTTAAAFELSGSPTQSVTSIDNAPRVLLDRTVVRGNPLSALSVNKTSIDLLARNCLLATGDAPVVRVVGGPADAADAARAESANQFRSLRFVECTAGARNTALEFDNQPGSNWQETTVVCHDTVFAAESGRGDAAFVSLAQFDGNPQPVNGRSAAGGMRFFCDGAPFCGWSNLVVSRPAVGLKVEGANHWNRFWQVGGNPAPSTARRLLSTPIADFAKFSLASIDLAAIQKDLGIDPATEPVGCRLAELHVPSDEFQTRAVAMAHRPLVPDSLRGVEPASNTIDVDLSEDLGRRISSGDWPSGTEFVVSGAGEFKSSPIRVTGKSFRIRFDSVAARNARVEPKVIEPKAGDEAGGAFIYVKRGNIEIINGSFEIPTATRRSVVRSFLKIDEGTFSIINTYVRGPLVESPGLAGLIEWKNSQTTTQVLAGHFPNHARIYGSYLTGGDTTLTVRCPGFGLSIDESMIVGSKDIIDVDVTGPNAEVDSSIDVRHSTFSPVELFVNSKFDPAARSTGPTLTVFAENTYFAPPVRKAGVAGTSLISPRLARDQHQLEWWGDSNGYAPEIAALLKGSGAKPNAGDAFRIDWVEGWGPAHELRALNSASDLALVKPLPPPTTIVPASFEFAGSAKAARWTIDGYSIGAEVSSFELPVPDASAAPRAPVTKKDDNQKDKSIGKSKSEPKLQYKDRLKLKDDEAKSKIRKGKYWHDKHN